MSSYLTESNELLAEAQKLAAGFQKSSLYQDYCRHKKTLEADPLLMGKVEAFKSGRMELESKRMQEGSVSFDEEKRIAQQYTELSLHPAAGAFLLCEYELLQLYKQAFDILSEACVME